jgi:hypothetical protein
MTKERLLAALRDEKATIGFESEYHDEFQTIFALVYNADAKAIEQAWADINE